MTKEQVPTRDGRFAGISQAGNTVSVIATRACDVTETTTVRRTTRGERVNQSPGLDWTLGALGAGLTASGAIVLIDSSNVYPNDSSSRQYNALGPNGARAAGASLAAVGATLATIAIVDVVRASGETESVETVMVPGRVAERGVRCANHPLAGAPVTLRLPGRGQPIEAGATGPDGRLTIDLESVLPPDAVFGLRDVVQVLVADEPGGTATLERLYAAREDAAWRAVGGDACAKPKDSNACDNVRSFLVRYAEGPHAAEGRALLTGAEPALLRLRDEQAWRALDSAGCLGLDDETADQVASACTTVENYINQFPNGQHLAAATEMRRNGAAVERRRRTDEERRAKDQANKDRADAARAQQKARACVQHKCSAICKVRCPYSASCLEGCVELCTSSDSLNSECGVGR